MRNAEGAVLGQNPMSALGLELNLLLCSKLIQAIEIYVRVCACVTPNHTLVIGSAPQKQHVQKL